MITSSTGRRGGSRVARVLAGSFGFAALGYAAWAAGTWHRYGSGGRDADDAGPVGSTDPLDRFMPVYEIEERHEIEVSAPAAATFAAARAMDINQAPLVRAIFAVRALPSRLRGHVLRQEPRSLVEETQGLGWRILEEVPDRLLVMGAYTQPWQSEVTFHGLSPAEFAAFREPGYAKIVWTLEAVPLGPRRSRFVTRTRVSTTDPPARARFRRYWAATSPGILLIRRASLRLVKHSAEGAIRRSGGSQSAAAAASATE